MYTQMFFFKHKNVKVTFDINSEIKLNYFVI